jgi:hypothetical protein
VLLCQGSNAGGWSFYVKDRKLCYVHNHVGRATYAPTPAARPGGFWHPCGEPREAHQPGNG